MLELLILIGVFFAAREGLAAAARLFGKGRAAYRERADRNHPGPSSVGRAARHDAGYFLSQLARGFPTLRHGFAQGWHEGMQAHHEALEQAQQARTSRLERHAGVIESGREHRRRQAAALERIRQAKNPPQAEQAPPAPAPPEDEHAPAPEPEDDHEEEDEEPAKAHCGCGRLISGGKCMGCGRHPEDCTCDQKETDTNPGGQPGQEEQDGQPVGEVTYASVRAAMDRAQAEIEQFVTQTRQAETVTAEHVDAAGKAKDEAATTIEEMQALEVDSVTVAAMEDYRQGVDQARQAAYELRDTATLLRQRWETAKGAAENAKAKLESAQGALAEAHAAAPQGGAQKGFFEA